MLLDLHNLAVGINKDNVNRKSDKPHMKPHDSGGRKNKQKSARIFFPYHPQKL